MEKFYWNANIFDRSSLRLLVALIHIKPRVKLNNCHLVLTKRLFHDDEGRFSKGYHQYCTGVPYMVTDKLLKGDKLWPGIVFF